MVANWDVLETVEPGHYLNAIEQQVDTALILAGIEPFFFLVAHTMWSFHIMR